MGVVSQRLKLRFNSTPTRRQSDASTALSDAPPEPDAYTYARYLTSKISVDDRALNRRVWSAFVDSLLLDACMPSADDCPSPDADEEGSGTPTLPLEPDARVVEVGGGVGATVERLGEALIDRAHEGLEVALAYTLIDATRENVEAARVRLPSRGRRLGFDVSVERVSVGEASAAGEGPSDAPVLVWSNEGVRLYIGVREGDALTDAPFSEGPFGGAPYDALIGQAVLDLWNVPHALAHLLDHVKREAPVYLPIHFDGVTAFEPEVDAGLDRAIERLYHRSMHTRQTPHGSPDGARTGRRLLTRLRDAGATLVDAGASDWVVFAGPEGAYPSDEAYFLHHILHFVEDELTGHPDLDADAFADWIDARRRQIDAGTLVYVAHQLDVLATAP